MAELLKDESVPGLQRSGLFELDMGGQAMCWLCLQEMWIGMASAFSRLQQSNTLEIFGQVRPSTKASLSTSRLGWGKGIQDQPGSQGHNGVAHHFLEFLGPQATTAAGAARHQALSS